MFGATIWTLLSQRSTHLANYKVFVVACVLLLFSTAVRVPWIITGHKLIVGDTKHLDIDIIRVMEGLILYRDTYPGGPVAYFSDVSQWTFVAKNYVYTTQTLIGDGVVVRFVFVEMSIIH